MLTDAVIRRMSDMTHLWCFMDNIATRGSDHDGEQQRAST